MPGCLWDLSEQYVGRGASLDPGGRLLRRRDIGPLVPGGEGQLSILIWLKLEIGGWPSPELPNPLQHSSLPAQHSLRGQQTPAGPQKSGILGLMRFWKSVFKMEILPNLLL